MIKIYGTKKAELELLPVLAEFRVRAFTSYPIKGITRKTRGRKTYRIINYPV